MGEFTKRVTKQLQNKNRPLVKEIEFACQNCLNIFTFAYEEICFIKNGDLEFTPSPECPRCGATEELVFSDFGQEKIEDMILYNQIKKHQ